jgi:hypothetical protein
MKRFEILKGEDCDYTLADEIGIVHKISLTFYDITPPLAGEFINFSEILLDKKVQEGIIHFHFGKFSNPSGRHIVPENMHEHMDEILIIESNDRQFYLKRLYG